MLASNVAISENSLKQYPNCRFKELLGFMMEEPRKGHFLEPTVHLEDQCFGDALCFKFKF